MCHHLRCLKQDQLKHLLDSYPEEKNPDLARDEPAGVWELSHLSFLMLKSCGQVPEHFHKHISDWELCGSSVILLISRIQCQLQNFKQMWQNSQDHLSNSYPLCLSLWFYLWKNLSVFLKGKLGDVRDEKKKGERKSYLREKASTFLKYIKGRRIANAQI